MISRNGCKQLRLQAAILLLLSSLICLPQNVSSGLAGTVVDPTDAIVPAAKVTATDTRTGFQKRTTTNESGYFSFPDLTSGEYTVEIQHGGFRKHQETDIALNSGEQRSLGRIRLLLGDTADTVTIEASGVQVQLGSSEKSQSITQEE